VETARQHVACFVESKPERSKLAYAATALYSVWEHRKNPVSDDNENISSVILCVPLIG